MARLIAWGGDRSTIIAHRGASSEAPENTIAAFDLEVEIAEAFGATPWIELDLQRSADGEVVVIHDDELGRTTNGHGVVAEHSLAALRELDAGSWRGEGFAGARIPTLDELVEWVAARGNAHVLVEYKGRWTPQQVTPTIAAFERAGVGDRLVLQSFDPRTVRALQQRAEDYARGLLLDDAPHYPAEFTTADLLGVSALNPGWHRVLEHPELVQRAHERLGAKVAVWTPDEPEVWAQLTEIGVDAVITNRPRQLHEWQGGSAGSAGLGG